MNRVRSLAVASAVALLVAACGGGTASSGAPEGALKEIGKGEGALNLIIWEGYAERGANDPVYDWVTPFEKETGCIVKTTSMTDSPNGVQLLQSGQYDGGSFSGDASVRLMVGGDVAPINVDLLTNYANVFAGLKSKPHNSLDGVPYGVPHGRGANVMMWNTDVVKSAPTSWDPVWEGGAAYKGKISVYDSSIYIADAALHLMATKPELGIKNPYQLNDAQFTAAIALLQTQRDNGAVYWGTANDQIQGFASGDLVVGTTWQYQANMLAGESVKVDTTLPAEGSTGWSDTWMMATKAAHPNCMYLWMNHMMSAEADALATIWFGEAPTSQAACDYAEKVSAGHCATFHATDEAYFKNVWYWETPREDCDWVAAWTTLRGN
ncbi:MAG: hypothetical protein RIR19_21 [Chloroflexota bacterium]|jgi:putative spermidine/putrescine transport system substrate-binding protein